MKSGGAFALNPHATSYVPLSKRLDNADVDGLLFATTQEISFEGVQVSMPNNSSEVAYKLIRNDEFDLEMEMEIDMDIEYLLVTFSGLSQESITDVYLANSGDLEATIEMLDQLEIYSNEAQENLPETLDLEDICESGPSTSKGATQNKIATQVAASSSVIPSTPVSA